MMLITGHNRGKTAIFTIEMPHGQRFPADFKYPYSPFIQIMSSKPFYGESRRKTRRKISALRRRNNEADQNTK